MSITPEEVRSTAFRLAWRGYATEEVDVFLDRVEEELVRLSGSAAPSADGPAQAPAGAGPTVRHVAGGTEPNLEPSRPAARAADAITVLQLAEQALQEAQANARAVRDAAAADAARTGDEAATVLADARREADLLVQEARARAAAVHDDVAEQRRAEVAELESRCTQLRAAAEQLHATYLQDRATVLGLMQEQLRRLQADEPLRLVGAEAVA